LEIRFPLQLRVTAAKGGQPDLQLRLLAFSSGTETDRLRAQSRESPALPSSIQGTPALWTNLTRLPIFLNDTKVVTLTAVSA